MSAARYLLCASLVLSTTLFARDWKDVPWGTLRTAEIEFFDRFAWDGPSGSCATNVTNSGKVVDNERWIVATGRGIYGYVYGTSQPALAEKAKRMADFLLNNMVDWSDARPYFYSVVDISGKPIFKGEETLTRPRTLKVYEQFYALTGLLALYHKTQNRELLSKINSLYDAWYSRFSDGNGGFYDTYDLDRNAQGSTHSFASTVYPLTAIYFSLYEAQTDAMRKNVILKHMQALADLAISRLYDPNTGLVSERWNGTVAPPSDRPMFMVGHCFQMAWALLRMSHRDLAGTKAAEYNRIANHIIQSQLQAGRVDLVRGGVYNGVFSDAQGGFVWGANKHWWQQTYAIMAITLAQVMGVNANAQALDFRDRTIAFYERAFVDRNAGGIFAEVSEDGGTILSQLKGMPGKYAYHATELPQMMQLYAAFARSQQSGGSESRRPSATPVQSEYRPSLSY